MKQASEKCGVKTIEKFTTENTETAVGTLPLGGTEPEVLVHGGNLLATYIM